MTKAVALAAGRGDRLQRLTDAVPKSMVPVAGRPMVHYVLESLAQAGVRDVVVVVGYRGEQVEECLGDGAQFGLNLMYAWNRDYTQGNASSLWTALPLVAGEPFLLVMADHLCSASLYRSVLDQADGRAAIAVDRSDLGQERTDEATKVALTDGLIVDLGKQLEPWDAIDTGISYWPGGAFASTNGARTNGARANGAAPDGELAALMTRIARHEGGLAAFDVSGHFWLDLDTADEIRLAEQLLAEDERRLSRLA